MYCIVAGKSWRASVAYSLDIVSLHIESVRIESLSIDNQGLQGLDWFKTCIDTNYPAPIYLK